MVQWISNLTLNGNDCNVIKYREIIKMIKIKIEMLKSYLSHHKITMNINIEIDNEYGNRKF